MRGGFGLRCGNGDDDLLMKTFETLRYFDDGCV